MGLRSRIVARYLAAAPRKKAPAGPPVEPRLPPFAQAIADAATKAGISVPNYTAREIGEEIASTVESFVPQAIHRWFEKVCDRKDPNLRMSGNERIWNSYDGLYYEAEFPSKAEITASLRFTAEAIVKNGGISSDIGSADATALLKDPHVERELEKLISEAATEINRWDATNTTLSEYAVERAYEKLRTDWSMEENEPAECPVHIVVRILDSSAKVKATTAQMTVTVQITVNLVGDLLYPGNRHYDDYL